MVGVSGDVDESHLDVLRLLPNGQGKFGGLRELRLVIVNVTKKHSERNDRGQPGRRSLVFGLNIYLVRKKLIFICYKNITKKSTLETV